MLANFAFAIGKRETGFGKHFIPSISIHRVKSLNILIDKFSRLKGKNSHCNSTHGFNVKLYHETTFQHFRQGWPF